MEEEGRKRGRGHEEKMKRKESRNKVERKRKEGEKKVGFRCGHYSHLFTIVALRTKAVYRNYDQTSFGFNPQVF